MATGTNGQASRQRAARGDGGDAVATTDASARPRTRRALALSAGVALTLALAACAPGALDASPPAASGVPSTSETLPASPTASPSAQSEPEGQRFDGVDLAAALVPLPLEAGEPERWGEWTTAPRDEILPTLDPAAFAGAPACAAAVEAIVAVAPEEVIVGGYPYEGTLGTSIIVARMASPADAAAYVAAIDAGALACEGVEGAAVVQYGIEALRGPFEPSPAIEAAGFGFVAVGEDESFHFFARVVAAHDELIAVTVSSMSTIGWDDRAIADIRTQLAALDAAAG